MIYDREAVWRFNTTFSFFIVFSHVFFVRPAVADMQQCIGIVESREVAVEIETIRNANQLYTDHCEQSQIQRSSSGALAIAIPKIPAKLSLSGGSNKSKMQHFCKTHNSWADDQRKLIQFQSSTTNRQWDSVDKCVALAGKGIVISPVIGNEIVNIGLTRGSENYHFGGVRPSPEEAFDCKTPNLANREMVPANSKIGLEITNSTTLTISCKRTAIDTEGEGSHFPAGEISVITDRGSLLIPVQRQSKYNISYATELEEKLSLMGNKITTLEGLLSQTWIQFTGQRQANTSYVNDTKAPITVSVPLIERDSLHKHNIYARGFVDDHAVVEARNDQGEFVKGNTVVLTVPVGSTYKIMTENEVVAWYELR